jgi:hypothetical protein
VVVDDLHGLAEAVPVKRTSECGVPGKYPVPGRLQCGNVNRFQVVNRLTDVPARWNIREEILL